MKWLLITLTLRDQVSPACSRYFTISYADSGSHRRRIGNLGMAT